MTSLQESALQHMHGRAALYDNGWSAVSISFSVHLMAGIQEAAVVRGIL